ncbi:voltage-dependent T-type calcium channel subunit alpha-1I-like, partial [Anarrhichthys ocellatus]|uniref:voltage-dependent T-type calcium channel subunit alpha-1I-like n=1 Tax=Anarrhichthys ocellatus TaxID=433405 RepID=UPI0012ED7325
MVSSSSSSSPSLSPLRFRLLCQSIIAHKLFDYVVLSFIFLNCITVALERPKILQGSLERLFLTVSNYVFTAIFVAEMTVKVKLSSSSPVFCSRLHLVIHLPLIF